MIVTHSEHYRAFPEVLLYLAAGSERNAELTAVHFCSRCAMIMMSQHNSQKRRMKHREVPISVV